MRRERKLTCFGRLGSELSMLRSTESLGALSPRQIRELRSLELLAVDARGTIKILRKRHEAAKAREKRDRCRHRCHACGDEPTLTVMPVWRGQPDFASCAGRNAFPSGEVIPILVIVLTYGGAFIA